MNSAHTVDGYNFAALVPVIMLAQGLWAYCFEKFLVLICIFADLKNLLSPLILLQRNCCLLYAKMSVLK
jgi:hypothetical protein